MKNPKIKDLIISARERKGWTRQDMVFELYRNGLRRANATVMNWESGKTVPKIPDLEIIAKTLNVSIGYFFDMKSKQTGNVNNDRGHHAKKHAA